MPAELVKECGALAGTLTVCPAEHHPDLSVKDGEHLLEVVAVRRWPTARRNVHVDEGVFAFRVAASHEDRVGVADEPDVREALILVGPRDGEPA